MLLPILASHQIREADRLMISSHNYPGLLLMERAAFAATRQLRADFPYLRHALILAGPGNNGGDGLAMARMLTLEGVKVSVWLSHPETRFEGDALTQLQWLRKMNFEVRGWDPAAFRAAAAQRDTVTIDALLGTGILPPVRGVVADMVEQVNASETMVVSIDLPSGLSADTGAVEGPVIRAKFTYTFQAAKVCHYVYPAAAFSGKTTVLDIGIWPEVMAQVRGNRWLLTPEWAQQAKTERPADAHKGDFGRLLVIAGSSGMAGAAALTCLAALRAGAGLVTLLAPAAVRGPVLGWAPEAMVHAAAHPDYLTEADLPAALALASQASSVAIGPGMGQHPDTGRFVRDFLTQCQLPVVVDADALNLLAARAGEVLFSEKWIITPHPGEMARLLPDLPVKTHRLETAEAAAKMLSCTVLLKGAGTLITHPDGETRINPTGNPGMATAGSGDVLTGIAGALLARGMPPFEAASLAAWAHGDAGDRAEAEMGQTALLARDIARHLVL